MTTLYDLLGALADDDAESLRAAFRRAAKANHPDSNPGDPDAPRRFRRIVHAHTILSDEAQRAIYDELLDIALQQHDLTSGRGILFYDRVRRAAVDTLTGAALTLGLFGTAYLLFAPSPQQVPFVPAHVADVPAPEAADSALILSTGPTDTAERASSHDKPADIAAPEKPENPAPAETQAAPSPPSMDTASAAPSPDLPPLPDQEIRDAKFYHQRGVSAYHGGDLYLALVDFDLAIALDPGASEAYIDRAIVYHRMGDLKHAFADVSKARRIDASKRTKAASVPGRAP
jgi:tetratricopeptide (TPR) repeat protein